MPPSRVTDVVHLGELGLDGSIRKVRGVLPAVLAAARSGCRDVVVPVENAAEAQLVPEIEVHAVAHLQDLVDAYKDGGDRLAIGVPPSAAPTAAPSGPTTDLAEVTGQPEARMALELAAAGGHHLFLLGPPGSGKTMLAERLVSILPRLTREQSIDVLAVKSLLGLSASEVGVEFVPPFIAPHHSATQAAIIGGGSGAVRPGAISQAHHGVLFLDEAPEFRTGALQALRQPLESGQVVVSRARTAVRFPARFQLVMAANPCPCGLGFGKGIGCICTPMAKRAYVAKLSGPLLDRVDLQVQVPPVTLSSLGGEPGESSAVVAARVAEAREVQAQRWRDTSWRLNSHVPGAFLRRGPRRLPRSSTVDLDRALDRGQLTLRGYDRVLRLGLDGRRPRRAGEPDPRRPRHRPDVAQPGPGGGMSLNALSRIPSGDLGARIAWARLVEPGDPAAAQRIAAVGAEAALHGVDPASTLGQQIAVRLPDLDVERDLEIADTLGTRLVVPGDEEWPSGLDSLANPAFCLWVRGPLHLAEVCERSVAVVGARAASGYGMHQAKEIAAGLAERAHTVVSGAAYGIDGAAHEGALAVDGRHRGGRGRGRGPSLSRRPRGTPVEDRRRGCGGQRGAAGVVADAVAVPEPQPADRDDEPGHGRRGGRSPLGLTQHRQDGDRPPPGGVCGPRTRDLGGLGGVPPPHP